MPRVVVAVVDVVVVVVAAAAAGIIVDALSSVITINEVYQLLA